ncbi:hypothetical protein UFOVP20_49 [uncultured Caudovirales phage]|uniref:Uncharacterized protein n=1 Tax=uncultured Caudovirales phage TaxID=2100421 RepID=A0A6J5KPL1_9CAUD|nr:hypothetical protein UFOVP20_49 [uncultured Caudovirales phage]
MADNPFLTSANPMQILQQAQQVPEELQPELRGITRQQQLANMLTQQAFQQPNQGQMVSGRYVAPSFFQGIAPMVNAYLGQRSAEQADVKQAALAEKLREGGNAEMQRFNELMGQGTPESQAKAFQYAQTAKYSPLLRNIGEEVSKPRMYKEGDVFKFTNPANNKEITLGSGGEKLSTEIRTAAQMLGLPTDTAKWSPQQTQAVNNQVVALKRAGANNTSVNVQSFVPFNQQLQGDMAKSLVTNFGTLEKAPNEIGQIDRALDIIKDNKAFVGTGAETKANIANFFNNNFGTGIDPAKVGTTGELGSILYSRMADNLKKMDSTPTERQAKDMQKNFGNLGTDPNALTNILKMQKEIIADNVGRHNKRVKEATESGAKFAYDITVNVPKVEKPSVAPAGVDQQLWDHMDESQRKLFK